MLNPNARVSKTLQLCTNTLCSLSSSAFFNMNAVSIASALYLAVSTAASGVSISVDVGGKPAPFRKLWLNCVGSSHASMSLRQDWRQQLTRASEEIGFKRVRFHGILDDDMSVYLPNAKGPYDTNMWNIFSTLDFLQDINMEPLVELSFMPREMMAAAAGEELTVMHYRGIRSPPKSWSQWNGFIQSVMEQIYDRYGEGYTVEVWNEPNCSKLPLAVRCASLKEHADDCYVMHWMLLCALADFYVGSGCNQTSGNFSAYQDLYANTAKSVMAANSAFRVAGPVTAQLAYLDTFLSWAVDDGNAPVKQVTSHLYPSDPIVNQSDRFGWVKAIAEAAEVVGKRGLNLTLSEFNAGLFSSVGVRDGPYTSAFLGHLAFASQSLPSNVDGVSFWTFSDVFEEQGMISTPFHDGFGLMTSHGINKPAYCAMQLLSRHGDSSLPVTSSNAHPDSDAPAVGISVGSVDAVATLRADGGVVVTLANFEPHSQPAPAAQNVTLTLTNLPSSAPASMVQVSRVDADNCNPMTLWQKQGSPMYPSRSQITGLAAVAVPGVSQVPCAAAGSDASDCTVTISVPSLGFVSVELLASTN
jgi:xylan 1,4-beta-xylosidase